jgi:nucleoside-diphosphate-sugar epimerase
MSLRVGVTGSSGFIGQHVMASLASQGHQCVAIRRPYELAALTPVFRSLDAVVHLAGVVSAARDSDFDTGNVASTRIVAEAVRETGIRIVHISSLAAAGPAAPSAPRTESDPPAPINAYGRTKLAGERIVRDLPDDRWIVLRPGVVYGAGDRALRSLFLYVRRGLLPIVGNPHAAYTFVYIDDAVRAIVAAVEGSRSGDVLFVGHADPVRPLALMEAIATTLGVRARPVAIPRALVRVAALCGDGIAALTGRPAVINTRRYVELYSPGFVCRVDRLRDRLGVSAEVGLREGLARSRAWYVGG